MLNVMISISLILEPFLSRIASTNVDVTEKRTPEILYRIRVSNDAWKIEQIHSDIENERLLLYRSATTCVIA